MNNIVIRFVMNLSMLGIQAKKPLVLFQGFVDRDTNCLMSIQ